MIPSILAQSRKLRDRTGMGLQIAVVTGLLLLALVLVVALSAAVLARGQATEQLRDEMTDLAGDMASRLDARMFERYREIRNIAALQPLSAIWDGDSDAIRSVLEQLQATLPEYAWIAFATPDGTVAAATGGLLEGASVAARPWFQSGLEAATVKDVHDAALLAQLLAPLPGNEPFRFVDVAVPVRAGDGEVVGVLGAHLSWTWASEVRRTLLSRGADRFDAEIWVLSATGDMLLGPRFGTRPLSADVLAQVARTGSLTFSSDDEQLGQALVAAVATQGYRDYPGLGWIVVAHRPLEAALSPANGLAFTILAIGLLGGAIGAALCATLALRLSRPLVSLTAMVDRLGRDRSATMVERGHGSSDIVHLTHAVRSLLRRAGVAESGAERARREAQDSTRRLNEHKERMGQDLRALQTLADTDTLTPLLNRRAFMGLAEDALAYSRRYGRSCGILLIDIDFFKRINDSHGHLTGDAAIRAVAEIVAGAIRTTDKAARFGGEEFIVLVRETDMAGTQLLADRIRKAISALAIPLAGGGTVHVTASVGAALLQPGDRDVGEIIERADQALYAAKSAGRDCVVIAPKQEPHLHQIVA